MKRFLLTSDRRFLRHCATTMASIVKHNPGSEIFFIHSGVNPEDIVKLRRFVSRYGSYLLDFEFTVDIGMWHVDKHASLANYFRIFVGSILPQSVDKILYLDSDIIVRKNLDSLFETDLEDKVAGAVWNPCEDTKSTTLGVSPMDYFNSGVMLLSLEAWRYRGLEPIVVSKLASARYEYWDQDVLNEVISGDWARLDPTFNVQHAFFQNPMLRKAFSNHINDPAIVHFSGSGLKPWQNSLRDHPFKDEYRRYRRLTPWPFYIAQGTPQFASVAVRKLKRAASIVLPEPLLQQLKSYRLRGNAAGPDAFSVVGADAKINLHETILPSADLRVLSGPFRGMRYVTEATGSAHSPKILGSYEFPIHATINELINLRSFSTFVDIGCAEGYYAVGIAMRCPDVRVTAFDISDDARRLCRDLAILNGAAEQVDVRSECTPEWLRKNVDDRTLLLCDVEGAEEDLLDPLKVPELAKATILVEAHDFLKPGISDVLAERFRRSHSVCIMMECSYSLRWERLGLEELLPGLDWKGRLSLLDERRPAGMRWLTMMPTRAK